MADSALISREEIEAVLIEVHRENQILWSKWFNHAADPAEKSGLYRFREGFDAAILNLAKRFQITLGRHSRALAAEEEKRCKVISLEKIVVPSDAKGVECLYCGRPLFRKGKKAWRCPVCDIDFHLREEEE